MSTPSASISRSDPAYEEEPPSTDLAMRASESTGGELRRIMVEQVDLASWHVRRLGVSDVHLHEVRKSTKRVRAVLRLMRDELSTESYREANSVLCDVARDLSQIRSALVRLETIDDLVEGGELRAETVAAFREELIADAARMRSAVVGDSPLGSDLAVQLESVRSRLEAMRISRHVDPTAVGLRRTYRLGRRAMAGAYRDGTPGAFHRWRKQVKYLRYQMEVLSPIHPSMITELAEGLEQIGDDLGSDHDLDDLRSVAIRSGSRFASPRHRREIVDATVRRSGDLRAGVRPLAERIYAPPPRSFVRQIAAHP